MTPASSPEIDLDALERLDALARAATPGDWTVDTIRADRLLVKDGAVTIQSLVDGASKMFVLDAMGKCPAITGNGPKSEANAAFIAAANPAATLKIIALCREALAQNALHEKHLSELVDDRISELSADAEAFDKECINYMRALGKRLGETGEDPCDKPCDEEWSADEVYQSVVEQWNALDDATERAEKKAAEALAREAALKDALEPFAAAVESLADAHEDRIDLWESPASIAITAGDLRAAMVAFKRSMRPSMTDDKPARYTAEQIKHMVSRFLQWKLPADISPDGGISVDWVQRPIGTNLLSAAQAEAMVRHMLDGLPALPSKADAGEEDRATAERIETLLKQFQQKLWGAGILGGGNAVYGLIDKVLEELARQPTKAEAEPANREDIALALKSLIEDATEPNEYGDLTVSMREWDRETLINAVNAYLAHPPSPVPGGEMQRVRMICETLGFDPTNHHNAAKCPYCSPVLSPVPGWRLVPETPTEEMIRAGWIDKEDVNPDDIWAAMLAAAPPSPQED